MEKSNPRIIRGLTILAQANQVRKTGSNTWRVRSQSGKGSYLVIKDGSEWHCECPDHQFRGTECKHIHAVKLKLSLMDSKEIYETYEQIQESSRCKYCGSYEIVRCGVRYNKSGKKQVYLCKRCNRKFSIDEGFCMHAMPRFIDRTSNNPVERMQGTIRERACMHVHDGFVLSAR